MQLKTFSFVSYIMAELIKLSMHQKLICFIQDLSPLPPLHRERGEEVFSTGSEDCARAPSKMPYSFFFPLWGKSRRERVADI
jgi:hypothetical protein